MKHPGIVSTGILLAAFQGAVWAQIYETKDEQGNPVYSDEPIDGKSSVIDLTETNIADAPTPAQDVEKPPASTTGAKSSRPAKDDLEHLDPNKGIWEDRVRRQQAFEDAKSSSTPHEVLDAEPPREVLEAEPRREVLDAEPRREVLEAEPRREVLDAEPRREVGDF